MSTTLSSTSYAVGRATVTKIAEIELDIATAEWLYPGGDSQTVSEIVPQLDDEDTDERHEHLLLSMHSWLVQIDGRNVLIDTAVGNDKLRPHNPGFHQLETPFLERLAAAGVTPDDVHAVLISHAHVDHVGWNTRLIDKRWVPTFPNAEYRIPRVEVEHYGSLASHNAANIPSLGAWEDSVWPVVEAGLYVPVEPEGGPVLEHFTYVPSPGHSIGHMSIKLDVDGEQGFFWGDVLHHPTQIHAPEWNSVFCEFEEPATRSRRWALQDAAASGALVFATHFPASSAGRVTRQGDDGFAWSYA